MYLLLFSYVTLMPVCTESISSSGYNNTTTSVHKRGEDIATPISLVDAILWLWTALIAAETFFRNYQLMSTQQFSHFLTKVMEMIFMVSFLAAYFMVRVIGQQPKLVNAFTARVLMCIGKFLEMRFFRGKFYI